jgi:hypothetical protein
MRLLVHNYYLPWRPWAQVLKSSASSYHQGWSHVFKTTIWNDDWIFRIDIDNGKNETSHVIIFSIARNHPNVLNFELAKVLITQKCFLVIHIWTKL